VTNVGLTPVTLLANSGSIFHNRN